MIIPAQTDARILIVDDQQANVWLLTNILGDEGYTNIETTLDPRQVISLVEKFKPDLILLDLMMPYMDGYAVMEGLTTVIPTNSYLPILVLTADATTSSKQRALSLGAKDFLTKPFDQIEVLLRIKNLLDTRILHLRQENQNQILEEKIREHTVQIRRQLEHLAALHTIDSAIAGSVDLNLTLSIALEQSIAELKIDAADVLLLNPYNQSLEFAAGRGFRTKAIEKSHLRLGEDFTGRAALDGQIVHIPDLAVEIKDFKRADLLSGEDFVSYFGIPLIAKGEIKGVLEIFHRSLHESNEEWIDFLEMLSGQVAIAVDSAQMFTNLKRSNTDLLLAYNATIEGWSRALDLRDNETEGHTLRVTEITLNLARSMGFSEDELVQIRRGTLLHDIGKMGVPDSILLKPGPLTDEEWVVMRRHPQYAYDMLSPIAYLRPALDIPYCHHEKWDGTGYPRSLKGEQIPLTARIFAVVDVWDALTSDRPYRKAWSKEKTREHIRDGSGSHFDPQVVEAFLRITEV